MSIENLKVRSIQVDAFGSSGKGTQMTNIKIRMKLLEKGLKQWELGKVLGKSESTIYRLLREELPEEEQDRIVKAIEERSHGND